MCFREAAFLIFWGSWNLESANFCKQDLGIYNNKIQGIVGQQSQQIRQKKQEFGNQWDLLGTHFYNLLSSIKFSSVHSVQFYFKFHWRH